MTRNSYSVAATILVVLSLSRVQAAPITVADEAKRKIEDLEASAIALANEADHFRMVVTNTQLDSRSHLAALVAIKEEINQMGREIAPLDAEREALPQWEQQAVARTLPLLKDSAANTESAIQFFNANRTHLWAGVEYSQYVDHICKDSEQMTKEIKSHLELAKLRDQEHRLNDRVSVESGE